ATCWSSTTRPSGFCSRSSEPTHGDTPGPCCSRTSRTPRCSSPSSDRRSGPPEGWCSRASAPSSGAPVPSCRERLARSRSIPTLVLSVLWRFTHLLRTGAPVSPRLAAVWTVVLAGGSTCFAMGLAVAAVFPLAAAVALPRSQLPRRSALVLLLGAVLTVAGY